MTLSAGTVCTGVGGLDLGLQRAGFRTEWQVEIDPHCRRVLRKRFPEAKLFEDMRDCGRHNLTRVDVIGGGTPCQERDAKGPDTEVKTGHLIPTAVPISDTQGRAGEQKGREGHGIGDDGDPMFTLQAKHHHGVAYRVAGDGAAFEEGDRTAPLTTGTDPNANVIAFSSKDHGADAAEELSPTLRAMGHDKSHANGGLGMAVAYNVQAANSNAMTGAGEAEAANEAETARCLDSAGWTANQGGTVVAEPVDPVIFQTRIARNGRGQPEDICPTLQGAGAGQTSDMRPVVLQPEPVAFKPAYYADGRTRPSGEPGEVSPPLTAQTKSGDQHPCVGDAMAVRRLAPVECERLQGFPDDFTWKGINEKGKEVTMSDSARTKQMGNAVTTTVAEWIGKRMKARLTP